MNLLWFNPVFIFSINDCLAMLLLPGGMIISQIKCQIDLNTFSGLFIPYGIVCLSRRLEGTSSSLLIQCSETFMVFNRFFSVSRKGKSSQKMVHRSNLVIILCWDDINWKFLLRNACSDPFAQDPLGFGLDYPSLPFLSLPPLLFYSSILVTARASLIVSGVSN